MIRMNDIMKWRPANTDRIETKKWTPLYSIVSGILIQFDVKSKPVITTILLNYYTSINLSPIRQPWTNR